MNETMSLVLATAILAMGGLGLYIYKSDENDYDDYTEDEEEVDIEPEDDIDDIEDFEEEEHPKVKSRGKTRRNKKSGGTKRKY